MSFTDRQLDVINKCMRTTGGCFLFAASVKSSGKCSDKQFYTMCNLLSKWEYRKNNKPYKIIKQSDRDSSFGDWDSCSGDYSSSEGYGGGDF